MRIKLYRIAIALAAFSASAVMAEESISAGNDIPEIVVTSEREQPAQPAPALKAAEANKMITGEVLAALNDRLTSPNKTQASKG